MRVLVTGGAGHIGSRLAAELESRGDEVRRFDVAAGEGRDLVQGDLRNFADVEAAVAGMDAVCHLGAIPGHNREHFKLFETNVRGTFHVYEAAAQHKVKKVVFASSICAMTGWSDTKPWMPDYLPIDERHPCQSDEMYGMSKEIGELLGRGYARRYGMKVICLRLCGVSYGDETVGPGQLLTANVTCADVVQAFCRALEADIDYGVYYISSRWRYTEDGRREDPAELARLVRESGVERIDNRGGFLEGRTTFSIARAERELGYDPAG